MKKKTKKKSLVKLTFMEKVIISANKLERWVGDKLYRLLILGFIFLACWWYIFDMIKETLIINN